jgi:hypothetical protein
MCLFKAFPFFPLSTAGPFYLAPFSFIFKFHFPAYHVISGLPA